jgi:hypothetical protein
MKLKHKFYNFDFKLSDEKNIATVDDIFKDRERT